MQPAQSFIEEEFLRTCLVAYESLPKDVRREGWGTPGTNYSYLKCLMIPTHTGPGTHNEGIRFRRALLDTVPKIGSYSNPPTQWMPVLTARNRRDG